MTKKQKVLEKARQDLRKAMSLWRISPITRRGFGHCDFYQHAVVAAETEEAARATHPSGHEWSNWFGDWVKSPKLVKAEYLGDAKDGTKPGIICADFFGV